MKNKIIEEIIKENKKLFNKKELEIMNNNNEIVKKIYMLGLIHAKQIYEK